MLHIYIKYMYMYICILRLNIYIKSLTHKNIEIIIVLLSLLYRELRHIEVKLLDKVLSVGGQAGIHI